MPSVIFDFKLYLIIILFNMVTLSSDENDCNFLNFYYFILFNINSYYCKHPNLRLVLYN